MDMWDCWSFTYCLFCTLDSLSNEASQSLFYRYYFGRSSSELAQLVPLLYSHGRSTRYSDGLHNFSVTITRCYKNGYVNSFFPCITRLMNSLPIECFSLTYDLNGFESKINRYVLTLGSFETDFPDAFNIFLLFFVTPCHVVGYSALHGVNPFF